VPTSHDTVTVSPTRTTVGEMVTAPGPSGWFVQRLSAGLVALQLPLVQCDCPVLVIPHILAADVHEGPVYSLATVAPRQMPAQSMVPLAGPTIPQALRREQAWPCCVTQVPPGVVGVVGPLVVPPLPLPQMMPRAHKTIRSATKVPKLKPAMSATMKPPLCCRVHN
jgi:hypothetical protein